MTLPVPHYSPARHAGGLVFVSGQLAFDRDRKIAGDTIEQQTRHCLENLRRVLAGEGLGLRNVVKTTVWLTEAADFAAFNDCYATFFPDTPPARSTVVTALAAPGALVEIEAIAVAQPEPHA